MAQIGDLHGLSTVLTASFYPQRSWLFWLYPLLRLGISEDLRARLRGAMPYYRCLSAIADKPLEQKTREQKTREQKTFPSTPPAREVAGIVELALRGKNHTSCFPLHKTHLNPLKNQRGDCQDYLYISNLAVAPIYRRQGIARKLLLSCEPLALQWGYQEIYLHVLENNERAKQLYLHLGYKIDRIEPQTNQWIWSQPRRLLLRKSLVEN